MKKRILCYGDSNTWGQSDHDTRIEDESQWSVILQDKLGSGYRVIQEGLGGRIAGDYELETHRNGKSYFKIAFESASPVDMVIISLGTNDLKTRFNRTSEQVSNDLVWYADEVKNLLVDNENIQPTLLYVAPANFVSSNYFEANEDVRQEVIRLLQQSKENVLILPKLTMSSDGVHYSEEAHRVVAEEIFRKIKELGL